jgi:hypothetical protein
LGAEPVPIAAPFIITIVHSPESEEEANGGGSQRRRRRQLTGNEKAVGEIRPRGLSRRRSPT